MSMDIDTYQALGLHQPAPSEVNGRSNADILPALQHPGDDAYHPCPEAHASDNIAAGTVRKYADWSDTSRFPDTVRDLYLYQPAVDHDGPFRVLICNDGGGYVTQRGPVRVPQVLDYLHQHGEIAPTIAVFANPGRPPGAPAMGRTTAYDAAAIQRSLEYDTLSPDYGAFILQELLPFAARELSVAISSNPTHRTVCGISSGGIAAFSAAWFWPNEIQRVISHCGSYTNIRGGHHYPYLVRTTPRKPLRVFLQSGENDGATLFGDWPTANQSMARALDYAGYDHRFEFGTGGHSLRHGGAIFANTLRWLWRETEEQDQ